jgi:hypothetical protein
VVPHASDLRSHDDPREHAEVDRADEIAVADARTSKSGGEEVLGVRTEARR